MSETGKDDVPTLVGVGLGPGDPELVTLKAVRTLEDADLVFVPDTGSDQARGRAETIVLAVCPQADERIRRLPFDMAERQGVGAGRERAWQSSAGVVAEAFAAGARLVAFVTVGDPSVYSTFSYLAGHVRQRVSGVRVETVPGVTAMQALAAASGTPLVEGQEILALVPATARPDAVESLLSCADSVVFYKVGHRLDQLFRLLADRRPEAQAVLGVDIGLPGGRVRRLDEVGADDLAYFSTLFVAPLREQIGGRL